MPQPVSETVRQTKSSISPDYLLSHAGARLGDFVCLTVSDTGCGMDESTLARIFEPFFTTKDVGKGSGLGLATVYGIVKQHKGWIEVQSELGRGTTFKIYLPLVDAEASVSAPAAAPPEPPRGTETVLLVEDAPQVRSVTRRVLERAGYVVLEASEGTVALQMAGRHVGPIHLLLTDLVMPGLGGRQIADELLRSRPETKVLFMSGYTDDAVLRRGQLKAGMAYIQKPFTPLTLAQKVRALLDAGIA